MSSYEKLAIPLVSPDHLILKQVAKEVTEEELKEISLDKEGIVKDMLVTMLHHKAIGLAAPQIGISKRIIVAKEPNNAGAIVLINPVIVKKSKQVSTAEESCLSCPNAVIKITRPKEVKVRSLNLDGTYTTLKYRGLLGREVQHEIDHLNGRLITDEN